MSSDLVFSKLTIDHIPQVPLPIISIDDTRNVATSPLEVSSSETIVSAEILRINHVEVDTIINDRKLDSFFSYRIRFNDAAEAPSRLMTFSDYSTDKVLYLPSQIGCSGSCAFCAFKVDGEFDRNLSSEEILALSRIIRTNHQVAANDLRVEFTEMGDAFYNTEQALQAIRALITEDHIREVEVCTSAPAPSKAVNYQAWIDALKDLPQLTLRISLHHSNSDARMKMMNPDSSTPMLNHQQIADFGGQIFKQAGKVAWLNYMVMPKNSGHQNALDLLAQFSPTQFGIVLTPFDSTKALNQHEVEASVSRLETFKQRLIEIGYAPDRIRERYSAGWANGNGNGRHQGPVFS